jgi:hypothetical protein
LLPVVSRRSADVRRSRCSRLPKLRTLKLSGDVFLHDDELTALGILSQLTSLSMHLS